MTPGRALWQLDSKLAVVELHPTRSQKCTSFLGDSTRFLEDRTCVADLSRKLKIRLKRKKKKRECPSLRLARRRASMARHPSSLDLRHAITSSLAALGGSWIIRGSCSGVYTSRAWSIVSESRAHCSFADVVDPWSMKMPPPPPPPPFSVCLSLPPPLPSLSPHPLSPLSLSILNLRFGYPEWLLLRYTEQNELTSNSDQAASMKITRNVIYHYDLLWTKRALV